jgi:hypothetical protein
MASAERSEVRQLQQTLSLGQNHKISPVLLRKIAEVNFIGTGDRPEDGPSMRLVWIIDEYYTMA